MNMKKRSLVLQAAVACAIGAMAGAANANIGTANRTFAVELFSGSSPSTTAISLAPISYQFTGPVAAASTFYVYVGLSGGATFTTAALTAAMVGAASDGSAIDSAGTAASGGTVQTVVLATDSTYARFTVVLNTGKSISSSSVFTFTPPNLPGTVKNANGALSTVGGTLTATWVNNSTATTGTIPAGDIDSGGTHSGVVATSAQGITLTGAASSAFPFNSQGAIETSKIDLSATPTSSKFTTGVNSASTTVINLGAIRAKNNSAIGADLTAYTIANMATTLSYTVAAPAGFFAPMGKTGQTWLSTSAADCSATLGSSASTVFSTAASAAAATTITVTGVTAPATATNYFVCMSIDSTNAAIGGTPTMAPTLVHANTSTDSNEALAAFNLYSLTTNGQSKYVRNYVPAAVTGWTNFLRIINTGSITADVSAAVVDEATGVAGTAAVILTGLKAGAATTINSTQIEAAIGAQSSSARPRLLITAPTNALEVQNFLFTPNGSFSVNQGTE